MTSSSHLSKGLLACALLTGFGVGLVHFANGCAGAQLTPDEAEKELDVACAVLARSVSGAHHADLAGLLARVCNAHDSRVFMERALVGVKLPPDIVESFDFYPDAGE